MCFEREDYSLELRRLEQRPIPQRCTCLQILKISLHSVFLSARRRPLLRGLSHCPFHPFADPVRCWRFRPTFLAIQISWALEINISIGRGAGGCAIPPFIRAIRTVPPDAPAFSAIRRLRRDLIRKEMQDPGDAYEVAKLDLLRLFQSNEASPSDVTGSVTNLMIVSDQTIG